MTEYTDSVVSVGDLTNAEIEAVLEDFFDHIRDRCIPVALISLEDKDAMELVSDERIAAIIAGYISETEEFRKENLVEQK